MLNLINDKNKKRIFAAHHSKMIHIAEDYWAHTVHKMPTYEKISYHHTVKEIIAKYKLNSITELIYLIFEFGKKYEGTCSFCKNDYFIYKIRGGNRSTYCGCIGICSVCKKPYDHGENAICSNCNWKERHKKEEAEQKKRDYIINVLLYWGPRTLPFYSNLEDVENIIKLAEKRIKFLKSYLKCYELKSYTQDI
jgi:hypothetical protein